MLLTEVVWNGQKYVKCFSQQRNHLKNRQQIFLAFLLFTAQSAICTAWKHFLVAPLVSPLGKIPSDAHAHNNVKLHHFCKKVYCITRSGNTVQQHQCGKQSIAGQQTVHGVFCQTITKSCQIHCQITNNMLEIISSKYCPNSATLFSLNDLLYH